MILSMVSSPSRKALVEWKLIETIALAFNEVVDRKNLLEEISESASRPVLEFFQQFPVEPQKISA
jgi:hypothetical protein